MNLSQGAFALWLFFCLFGCRSEDGKNRRTIEQSSESPSSAKEVDMSNMVAIPGGTFVMGATQEGGYQREYPPHQVEVKSIFMDTVEVSNAAFQKFIDYTGYITVAERQVDWEELRKQVPPGTPKPDDSLLEPGSIIFAPNPDMVNLNNHFDWWAWKNGANWKNINGDSLEVPFELSNPVVQVAYMDAVAYCQWKGKRLPTEAEWEHAAKGGLSGARFSWGEEDPLKNPQLTNIFQGVFPRKNSAEDGFAFMAPVGSFLPNGYGLYDMAGNVWEWTSDLFDENYYASLAGIGLCKDPTGSAKSFDPRDPYALKRVIKGGSYLCHVSYCENYRPSAREGSSEDSGMPHLGLRCVVDAPKN